MDFLNTIIDRFFYFGIRFILFILLNNPHKASSQDTIAVIQQKIKNFDVFNGRLLQNKESNTYYISINDKGKLHQILIDSNFKVTGQFTDEREWIIAVNDYKNFDTIASTKKNVFFSKPFHLVYNLALENKSDYINVFVAGDNKAYYFQKVSFQDSKNNYLKSWIADTKEKVVSQFKVNNCFYWITYFFKTNQYRLYKFNPDYSIQSIDLSFLTKYNTSKVQLHFEIPKDITDPLFNLSAAEQIKIFIYKGILYISDNNNKEGTSIVHAVQTTNLQYLFTNTFKEIKENEKALKLNSFVYKDTLFQATLLENIFLVTLYDINTNKKLSEYKYHKNTLDSLFPHLLECNDLKDSCIEVTNSKNIWDEIGKENIFISAFKINDTLQLNTGLIKIKKDRVTPIISLGLSLFMFHSLFPQAGFLVGVRVSPQDQIYSLYYKFYLQNSTIINSDNQLKLFYNFSKEENNFYTKHKNSIIDAIITNKNRIYICYSKSEESIVFIRFKQQIVTWQKK